MNVSQATDYKNSRLNISNNSRLTQNSHNKCMTTTNKQTLGDPNS